MDKKEAELLIKKENEKKIKKQIRMKKYRDNDDFRDKNAEYMRDYRQQQKNKLIEAKKIIENNNIKMINTKLIEKHIDIILKNNKLFNINLNKKTFSDYYYNNDYKSLINEINYLTNIDNFINIMKNKYKNKTTLNKNLYSYIYIFKNNTLFKEHIDKIKDFRKN